MYIIRVCGYCFFAGFAGVIYLVLTGKVLAEDAHRYNA